MVILLYGWLYFTIICLLIVVGYLCVTWIANIITVPTFECTACCFFTITPEVVTANTLSSPACSNLSLFDDAKRGKMRMTMSVFLRLTSS